MLGYRDREEEQKKQEKMMRLERETERQMQEIERLKDELRATTKELNDLTRKLEYQQQKAVADIEAVKETYANQIQNMKEMVTRFAEKEFVIAAKDMPYAPRFVGWSGATGNALFTVLFPFPFSNTLKDLLATQAHVKTLVDNLADEIHAAKVEMRGGKRQKNGWLITFEVVDTN